MKHFICKNCGEKVPLEAYGTKHRNHCPKCLYSLHVDVKKGDRDAECDGLMQPVGKFYKEDGEEVLVHKCIDCGFLRWNRVAGDDSFEAVAALPEVPDPR
ncbi:RNHCP domain-containing protein [candidate division WWE3 bacterium]|nr:RNHCP domain-containing protein [candidate division WWE3 bacterium]